MRSPKRDTCLFCEKLFTKLPAHLLTHTQEKPFFCRICKTEFALNRTKIVHERIHSDNRDYTCSFCEKAFKRKNYLDCHIVAIHTLEKSYKCSKCPSKFATASLFYSHKRTHQKEKPFKCSKCSKSFKWKKSLSLHLRLYSSEPKPFCCDICHRAFAQKGSLTGHKKRIHHRMNYEDRRHVCSLCSKRFITKRELVQHSKTHEKERPYKCVFCRSEFTQSGNLETHIHCRHLRERPYICAHCDREFAFSKSLKRHINAVHNRCN